MNIKGLTNLSLIDWDGEVCSIIFVGGCNFKCPNCHNAPLVLEPEKLKSISEADILQTIEGYREYITGVCISGGEATLQTDLHEFCKKLKDLNLKVKLDTNGKHPMMLEYLIKNKLVDYIAMDIKAPLTEKDYTKAAGIPIYIAELADMMYSIDLIKNSGIDYEFRTTVIPRFHKRKDIKQICKYGIRDARRYIIQNFYNSENLINPKMKTLNPFSQEKLEGFAKIAQKYVQEVKIRNLNRNL